MNKKQKYRELNVDLAEYDSQEKSLLYKSSIGYVCLILIFLVLPIVFKLNLATKIVIDIFILILVYIELKSSLDLRKRMILNRENRLKKLFDNKLHLNSDIYVSKIIKQFNKRDIESILVINDSLHYKYDGKFYEINAMRYDNDWLEDVNLANQLIDDHYAVVICQELNQVINPDDFSKFINRDKCRILSFYENQKEQNQ